MAIQLVIPNSELLPSYLEAIQEAPYCNMALSFGDDAYAEILKDQQGYLNKIAKPAPWKVTLPDGAEFTITDHVLYWITDRKRFIGSLPFRFAGDAELIENYCGHVGLAIRPSLLNLGYGVKAIGLAANIAREKGVRYLLLTCDPNNSASKRLIEHAGGKIYRSNESFHGTGKNLIYEIDCSQ